MSPDLHLPERVQSQVVLGAVITGQAQTTAVGGEHLLADLMIANGSPEPRPETLPQLVQTFPGALERGVIGHPDAGAVTGIIPVGHAQVRSSRFFQEAF